MATAYFNTLDSCQAQAAELRALVFAADQLAHDMPLPEDGRDEANRLCYLLSVCRDFSTRLTEQLTDLHQYSGTPSKEG